MGERLERGDESFAGTQRPLGDARDLTEIPGQQADDLVAFTMRPRTQDNGRGSVGNRGSNRFSPEVDLANAFSMVNLGKSRGIGYLPASDTTIP